MDEFTTGQVAEEMMAAGTSYAPSTIAKMMRRMSGPGERSYEHLELERVTYGSFRRRHC